MLFGDNENFLLRTHNNNIIIHNIIYFFASLWSQCFRERRKYFVHSVIRLGELYIMFKSMKAPKNGAGSSAESLAPDQTAADDRNSSGPVTPPGIDTPKMMRSPVSTPQLDQPTLNDFRTPGSLTEEETPTNVVIIPNSNTSTDLSAASVNASGAVRSFSSRPTAPRSQSAGSSKSVASTMSSTEICRICHCEATTEMPLISPCYCSGTLKYVHQKCLQQWIKSSQTRSCEVCRFSFIMQTKLKPFRKVYKLVCVVLRISLDL